MRRASVGLLALGVLATVAQPVSAQRSRDGWIGISVDVRIVDGRANDDALVFIEDVRRDSPAAEAGLRPGDRLISINDLRGAEDFLRLPERLRLRVGERVRIRTERDGRRREVVVRAAERPDDIQTRTVRLAVETDQMVETMVRAMDSLRVQLMQMSSDWDDANVHTRGPLSLVREAEADGGVTAPFEFYVFRGEAHDSLRQAMEALTRARDELRQLEEAQVQKLQRSSNRRAVREAEEELERVRASLEEVTRESAELRGAMSGAARASAGAEYIVPGWSSPIPVWAPSAAPPSPQSTQDPTPVFRPLTPYVVGSNMVAGAHVIDLRPELAQYFAVENGVLIVDVAPGTPAAMAGLVPGDVITRIDQVGVRSVEELRFGVSRSGEALPISLVRQGRTLEVLLRR
jgi:hypothetical protein